MLDLRALEEAQAPVDAVRHAGAEQRVLEHARLGVRAVEDRDLGECQTFLGQPLDDVDDERRLVDVRRRGHGAHRVALALGGPQVLAQPRRVVADQGVGGVEDVALRTVVLLELDEVHRHAGPAEVALDRLHVGDLRAPEGVDRLVVVADREHRRVGAGEELEPPVLELVGVLELVDEQVREAPAVVLAQRVVPRQELEAAQQELGEVDHALALAGRVVERVELDHAAREIVACLDLVRRGGPPPWRC